LFHIAVTSISTKETLVFAAVRKSVAVVWLPAAMALLLSADSVRAQNGRCQGNQNGPGNQLGSSPIQMMLQQQTSQMQSLLQQLQNGQITLPANSQISSVQLQTLLQQRITQMQAQLQQLQTGQLGLQQSGQMTSSQSQAALQRQAALAMQMRAAQMRGRR
jgi:hypothetical protein